MHELHARHLSFSITKLLAYWNEKLLLNFNAIRCSIKNKGDDLKETPSLLKTIVSAAGG